MIVPIYSLSLFTLLSFQIDTDVDVDWSPHILATLSHAHVQLTQMNKNFEEEMEKLDVELLSRQSELSEVQAESSASRAREEQLKA